MRVAMDVDQAGHDHQPRRVEAAVAAVAFREAADKIRSVERGREAAMYGPLRDLFAYVLGYASRDVDIDTAGTEGRPDVTVRAPSGLIDFAGRQRLIDWIVVEAKDEPRAFLDPDSRERIFASKSKYITPNTAWFVMADPQSLVARPAQSSAAPGTADIVFELDGKETLAAFKDAFRLLHADVAGVPERLAAFRRGDTSAIATDKLAYDGNPNKIRENRVALNRRTFFATIRETTELLQDACRIAFTELEPAITAFRTLAEEFAKKYDGFSFSGDPIVVRGNPVGPEATIEHNRRAAELRRVFGKDRTAAVLAFEALPSFQSRTGADGANLSALFTTESANLILARIMLMRFLEDNGFFGTHKYMCNGGVEAFQAMKEYFDVGYTRLLEDAFRTASKLYAAAFSRTDLDWTTDNGNKSLSDAIEWSMYQLSRYDFATVRGDTLTGIYDRFLDRKKRKAVGEFYTPPSVARFIVEATGINQSSLVFDPACGSGTFLIEAFDVMVGDAARRGAAEWDDLCTALTQIAGNDINTFSAVLAQIQMIWQILPFKDELLETGFPDLGITANNALVRSGLNTPPNAFTELDRPIYDAVIGNPPYIRAERNSFQMDRFTRDYFEQSVTSGTGISSKSDHYALFLYKALDWWCKPYIDGKPGRVGFVMPLALLDSNENEQFRRLFRIGGRFTIKEIVDLELVYESVFDADTIPMILIAEARPATDEDVVRFKIADPSAVQVEHDAIRPTFEFDGMPNHEVNYARIFTEDGRIPTRVTPSRAKILDKMEGASRVREQAKPYWQRKQGARVVAWTAERPNGDDSHLWERRQMLARGFVFRSSGRGTAAGGIDIYKSENISACELVGVPAALGIEVRSTDDPAMWRFLGDPNDLIRKPAILPHRAYAVSGMAHCPNLVAFDPSKVAFTDTATIFVPRDEVSMFPFDMLFLSNVYVYYYALRARMGLLRTQRSHIYPTNFGMMPWNDRLLEKSAEIESMRNELISTCKANFQTKAESRRELAAIGCGSLKDVVRRTPDLKLLFSESFDAVDYATEISPYEPTAAPDGWTVGISRILTDFVQVNNERLGVGIYRALEAVRGEMLKRKDILALRIPFSDEEMAAWEGLIAKYAAGDLEQKMNAQIRRVDMVVAEAFGLAHSDLDEIERDMATDPFLSKVRPRYPGVEIRQQGFRQLLDQASRYD